MWRKEKMRGKFPMGTVAIASLSDNSEMPFTSDAQRRAMYANDPQAAEEFAHDSPPESGHQWLPSEHVAIVGQTGTGKTHLTDRLIRENRRYAIVFKTKLDPEDEHWAVRKYWRGFHRIEKASEINNPRFSRFVLIPPIGPRGKRYDEQYRQGWDLIDRVYKQGRWTVVFDEEWYCEKFLAMREGVELLLTQGRGKGISVVTGFQRPSQITRFALSQAQHVFAFAGDGRDARTIGESAHLAMRDAVAALTGHDFAHYHQRTRTILRGNARRLSAVIRPLGGII